MKEEKKLKEVKDWKFKKKVEEKKLIKPEPKKQVLKIKEPNLWDSFIGTVWVKDTIPLISIEVNNKLKEDVKNLKLELENTKKSYEN